MKRKILPTFAIKYCLFLLLLVSISLLIIDRTMPNFSKWKEENSIINKNIYKHAINFDIYNNFYLMNYDHKSFKKEKSNKKILIIGDSFIYGDGSDNINYTWWRQLQYELYNSGYYDVSIYAFGQNGKSTYDELLLLKDTTIIDEIKPDLIIIGYVNNDPEDVGKVINILDNNDYFKNNIILKSIKKLIPNISYKINNELNSKYQRYNYYNNVYNDETGYSYKYALRRYTHDDWLDLYYNNVVSKLADCLKELNIPAFVVYTNSTFESESSIPLKVFEKANIKTYDTENIVKEIIKSKQLDEYNLKINPVNGHPGPLLTYTYGKYIVDILKNDYNQVLGKKYDKDVKYPININYYLPYELDPYVIEDNDEFIKYKLYYDYEYDLLTLPINKKYLKLSLEYPTTISKIELDYNSNNNINNNIYLTYINNELGYDDRKFVKIGKNGNYKVDNNKLVSTINISIDDYYTGNIFLTLYK